MLGRLASPPRSLRRAKKISAKAAHGLGSHLQVRIRSGVNTQPLPRANGDDVAASPSIHVEPGFEQPHRGWFARTAAFCTGLEAEKLSYLRASALRLPVQALCHHDKAAWKSTDVPASTITA